MFAVQATARSPSQLSRSPPSWAQHVKEEVQDVELEAAEGEAELEGDKLEYFSCAGECPGEEVGDEVGKDAGSWPLPPPPPPPGRARAAAAKRDCHGEEEGDKVSEVDETWGSWAPQVPPPPELQLQPPSPQGSADPP